MIIYSRKIGQLKLIQKIQIFTCILFVIPLYY
jgi:hypothetical protein